MSESEWNTLKLCYENLKSPDNIVNKYEGNKFIIYRVGKIIRIDIKEN